ncbi:HAMP domain-containing sensor histidine kinase [Streptomyces sp. AS02]|uniref:sensor histidine kinase n=1 Tax=Streptomyces sp. AS02 TaxID=2938946 RepID=UPI002020DEBA|nr:HAMP domain-containing sensor histidine kinase [Streptomyces sp. AS02]MCL8017233.1 HAMP domain-containing histidine kinase [Streptomyces sp. AS02]
MRRRLRQLRPRSLRSRLVLTTSLLATSAVVVCQVAGLAVLRSWLVDQVDDRLLDFRPPIHVYWQIADTGTVRHPDIDDALPSDFHVSFYDADGRLLPDTLGGGSGPRLPRTTNGLELADGETATVPGDKESGRNWRVVADSGPDGMRAVVALPLDTVSGATTKLLWFGLALDAAVVGGVVLLGNSAVRLGLRPLSRIEQTAQHITDGNLQLSVPATDPETEVGRLGLALNTMLHRLRTAVLRAETSETRLRRFMADAGHELRTPLTSIQGFAELLLDESTTSGPRRREAHELIAHNADRMSRLVGDLFTLAKLGDAPAIRRETVDMLSLAAEAVTANAVRHPQRHIRLEPLPDGQHADHERELTVVETLGDAHQLAQVLENLLANACAHTSSDTRVRVRVGNVRTGPRTGGTDRPGRTSAVPPLPSGVPACVVEVADDGSGIGPHEAGHVFDRFYRAARTRTNGEPGSGLGLAIASAIAEAHGGRLELDTRPGEGCTFRLLLPDPPVT